jgi:two-component system OmpR family sensor kinase
MSAFHQSIRWRMQLWHGLVLLLVLVAFGATACWFVRSEQLARIDQELRRRVSIIVGGGPRGGPGGGRPPGPGAGMGPGPEAQPGRGMGVGAGAEGQPGRGAPFRVPPGQRGLFEESERGSFYFIIWNADGTVAASSETAPENVPPPDPASMPRPRPTRMRDQEPGRGEPPEERFRPGSLRIRGVLREFGVSGPGGELAVVGHSMEPENAELRRLTLLFSAAGGGVLVLGLLVGGWFSGRAIRPIADISSTAKQIAGGSLSERINVADTGSELGELAKVLNETFDRLQSSIARQAQFTADASHELRTPAFVILSEAQSALKRERTAAEYREGFEVCQRAAQQMRQLIESLLILARQDAGEGAPRREPARLDAMMDDVVAMLQPLAKQKDVTLHTEMAPIQVACDAQQLRQVVTNLISNAIEYNRPAGEVRVSLATEAGELLLTVADTGVGIAPEDLPHIFERFYRADKSRTTSDGHTGLGLAICDAIVKAHGGKIEVTSEVGRGSKFVVRLPV